ncbi:hypothetical protein EW093_09970 [Thiospirochaeta perfilievii]|uniref:Zinc ribbon domain-containing protein n=1 Tax=Thiospirochaeta perfilievii TaxID=252967 RepID=A0A5C1QFN2_9SPIO|nr:hypothetical protein [Thiospirochaeta perfilievii]QEN05022.1 hypothetical protein EW093_09970 [Thiospirochaeta perfilievii]
MPYCIHCGVKLNHRYSNCPLCQIPVEFPEKRKETNPLYPKDINKISIIKGQANSRDINTIHFLRFITILTILLTTGINYYLKGVLSWSLISTISLIFIYMIVTATLHLKRNPLLLYIYLNVILGLYLYLLDVLIIGLDWFIFYALPCFISIQVISLITKILFYFIKSKLLRSVTLLVVTDIFLILINLITARGFTWSRITTSIIVPTSLYLIFFYFKSRSKRVVI